MDYSDYYIAKVNTLWALKSMDPFTPFHEFLENNHKDLKKLLESKRIVVINAEGTEVDLAVVEKYIIEFYKNVGNKLDLDSIDTANEKVFSKKAQKLLKKIKKNEAEKIDLLAHKEDLIKTLKKLDDENIKIFIQEGIDLANIKIETLNNKCSSLLISINKELKL